MGFTIPELLVAAAIGLLTAGVAGQAMMSHVRSTERAEALERQRNDWSRTTQFIESEIALSERLIDDDSNITIPSSCDISTSSPNEFRFAIDSRRDLPLTIYAVKESDSSWLPENTLWRCGPGLERDGHPKSGNKSEWEPLLDGLDGNATDGGFEIDVSQDGKFANFTLALKGHATVKYGLSAGARSRISPLFTRPSENSLCEATNMFVNDDNKGDSTNADPLTNTNDDEVEQALLNGEKVDPTLLQDTLMCGYGGGDTVIGANYTNDLIEAGDTGASFLDGKGGNDVLRGTNDNDTINGGTCPPESEWPLEEECTNDDVLVGRGGNDSLNGGSDKNIYLPGDGDDTITGGNGLDIIFFDGNRSDYTVVNTDQNKCDKNSCTVTHVSKGIKTITNGEILIFNDARLDL